MAERPVINASPLILLAHTGRLGLLRAIYGNVVDPGAVADEVLSGASVDPAAEALRTESWLQREAVPAPAPEVAGWDLGRVRRRC